MKPAYPARSINKHLGFTLIEVMVAVAIFALAGGAVMKSVYEHLRSLTTLERITLATWVANNELTRSSLEARIKWPLEKDKKGEMEMAGSTWYWQRITTKTTDDGLYQITVTVSTDAEIQSSITSVTSYLTKIEPNE